MKCAYAMVNFMLCIKYVFSILEMWFMKAGTTITNNNTPKTLKTKLRYIILLVLFSVFIVDKKPVMVVPILAPNIIRIDEVSEIRLLKYISSTKPIKPDDDWIIAVHNIPNSIDNVFIDWILFIKLYICVLLMMESNPTLNTSNPKSINPIYIIRTKYFLYLLKTKKRTIPIIIIYKDMLEMFIATIKVVKHVPKLAPIIIPKHCFGLMKLDDNSAIEIAVIPEDDWIKAEAIQPHKKDLNFVLTDFCI